MEYFNLYIPRVADGLNIRIGCYISVPDIEAQLAVNNYTYSHSLLFSYDPLFSDSAASADDAGPASRHRLDSIPYHLAPVSFSLIRYKLVLAVI